MKSKSNLKGIKKRAAENKALNNQNHHNGRESQE